MSLYCCLKSFSITWSTWSFYADEEIMLSWTRNQLYCAFLLFYKRVGILSLFKVMISRYVFWFINLTYWMLRVVFVFAGGEWNLMLHILSTFVLINLVKIRRYIDIATGTYWLNNFYSFSFVVLFRMFESFDHV